jgi:hypothetical protein
MNGTTCPSCGLATDQPHDTQEACIEALHREIARVRNVLDHVKDPGGQGVRSDSREQESVETKNAATVF